MCSFSLNTQLQSLSKNFDNLLAQVFNVIHFLDEMTYVILHLPCFFGFCLKLCFSNGPTDKYHGVLDQKSVTSIQTLQKPTMRSSKWWPSHLRYSPDVCGVAPTCISHLVSGSAWTFHSFSMYLNFWPKSKKRCLFCDKFEMQLKEKTTLLCKKIFFSFHFYFCFICSWKYLSLIQSAFMGHSSISWRFFCHFWPPPLTGVWHFGQTPPLTVSLT